MLFFSCYFASANQTRMIQSTPLVGRYSKHYTRAQIIGSSNPILFDVFKLATSDPTHPVYIAIGSVQNPTDRL
jgi:hypothetical protein